LFTGTGSIAERVLHCFLPKIPLIYETTRKKINDQDNTIVEQKDMMQKQASMIVHICKKKW
jgi:hypothetical protein